RHLRTACPKDIAGRAAGNYRLVACAPQKYASRVRYRFFFFARELTFFAAASRAARTLLAFAEGRLTYVQPWRPQAPLQGLKISGAFSMNARCCSGVSLTIAQFLSGHPKRRENLSGHTEIGMMHVRPLDRPWNFRRHLSKLA